MPVDPDMDFSASESSDFEDIIHVREGVDETKITHQNDLKPSALDEVECEEKVIQRAEGVQSIKEKSELKEDQFSLTLIDAQWLNRLLTKF